MLHLLAIGRFGLNQTSFLMKKLLFFCSLMLFFSCDKEKSEENFIVGDWNLVEIYNPWTGTSSSENLSDFFQTYQFMSDGTFKKTRKSEGEELKEATGVYTLEDVPLYSSSDAKLFIYLTFTAGDDIYNNCGNPNEEQLTLRFSNKLSNFSATPCDGAGFTFEKD